MTKITILGMFAGSVNLQSRLDETESMSPSELLASIKENVNEGMDLGGNLTLASAPAVEVVI